MDVGDEDVDMILVET